MGYRKYKGITINFYYGKRAKIVVAVSVIFNFLYSQKF